MNFGLVEYWIAQEIASWIDRDKPEREAAVAQIKQTEPVICKTTHPSETTETTPTQAVNLAC